MSNKKTEIVVAVIGVIGVAIAAVLGNLDKIQHWLDSRDNGKGSTVAARSPGPDGTIPKPKSGTGSFEISISPLYKPGEHALTEAQLRLSPEQQGTLERELSICAKDHQMSEDARVEIGFYAEKSGEVLNITSNHVGKAPPNWKLSNCMQPAIKALKFPEAADQSHILYYVTRR